MNDEVSKRGMYSLGTTEVGNIPAGNNLLYLLLILALVAGLYVIIGTVGRTVRHLTCLGSEKQSYFRTPTRWVALLKQHLFDAPLFRRRHHWSPRIGLLPTRLQTILLAIVIGANIAFAVTGIEWYQPRSVNTLKHFRNRTGTLAVINMIPLFVLAGRNNPLIPLLGISYDKFNMLHRWLGRICAVEALAHFGSYFVADYFAEGQSWPAAIKGLGSTESLIITGWAALCAFLVLNIQALAFFRQAFYEFFLHFHILLVTGSIIAIWYHLEYATELRTYLGIAIAAWLLERFVRVVRIVYRNFGRKGMSRAQIEMLPGNAMRVTYQLARPWTFRPGQYIFVTIPSIGLWTSHPFSIAWSEEETRLTDEKGLQMTRQDVLAQTTAIKISTIVRGREGFTQKLLQKAATADGTLNVAAIVEGPYGSHQSLRSYGTVVLFAGGVGITHMIPCLRSVIVDYANGVTATRRVSLIWVVQSPEHLEWIQPWLRDILALDRRREVLRIQIFITRPRSAKEVQSPSDTYQMFPGRPNVETVLQKEIATQTGAMAVSVCGTGGLSDDVRQAVRSQHLRANIDLREETFSW